jgi:hypothetical protein
MLTGAASKLAMVVAVDLQQKSSALAGEGLQQQKLYHLTTRQLLWNQLAATKRL